MSTGASATAIVEPTAAFGAPGTSRRARQGAELRLRGDPVGGTVHRVGAAERAVLDEHGGIARARVPVTDEESWTCQFQASLPWLPAAPSPTTFTEPGSGGASSASSSRMSWP